MEFEGHIVDNVQQYDALQHTKSHITCHEIRCYSIEVFHICGVV